MDIEGTCLSKNLDEAVRLQPEKREEWIRKVNGERLQGTAEGSTRLVNSSAASFPGRNECPGAHCSLIVQEEREDSSCKRVCGERKDGGEDKAKVGKEKRNGRLAGAAETTKKLEKWRRLP